MKIREILNEGFSGFTVVQSDEASDLLFALQDAAEEQESKIRKKVGDVAPDSVIDHEVCKHLIKLMRKKFEVKGNAYNTPGILNVAMIVLESLTTPSTGDNALMKYTKFNSFKEFIGEVVDRLEIELEKGYNDSFIKGAKKVLDALKEQAKKLHTRAV